MRAILGNHPRRTLAIVALILAVVVILTSAVIITRQVALASPEQPLPFSHQRHTKAGVQCLFCHVGAMRSDVAGIPSVQKCMGCHQTIATTHPPIQALASYWDRQEPIPWQPVTPHSDLVFFSHQAHLQNAVSCEACHGQVGDMEQTYAVENMDMGFCLACHLEQPPEKVVRLQDCLTCHK